MKRAAAYDYGEYERLARDPRTRRALAALNRACGSARVRYAVVGGYAAYLHTHNPPTDFPDIDVLLYADGREARAVVERLARTPGFNLLFAEVGDGAMFSTFEYDGAIQIDVFTSTDERVPRATRRIRNVSVEPVEPLIVEKLIRGTRSDVLMALDLLAYTDYDRRLLSELGRQYRMSGMLHTAAYFARRMAVGRLSKAGLESVAKRLTTA